MINIIKNEALFVHLRALEILKLFGCSCLHLRTLGNSERFGVWHLRSPENSQCLRFGHADYLKSMDVSDLSISGDLKLMADSVLGITTPRKL